MNSKFIKFITLCLLVSVGVTFLSTCQRQQAGPEQKQTPTTQEEKGPVKIGWIGPLTGDAAELGEPMKNTVEIAVREINAGGGDK